MNSPSVPAARPAENAFPVRGPFNWGQEAAAFGGPRAGRSHEGQDVMSRTGTPIVAVADGTVLETGNDGGRGNYLNLYDPAQKVTYVYMHMVAPPRPSRARTSAPASAWAAWAAPARASATTCTSRSAPAAAARVRPATRARCWRSGARRTGSRPRCRRARASRPRQKGSPLGHTEGPVTGDNVSGAATRPR